MFVTSLRHPLHGCTPQLPMITEKVNESKNKTILLVRIILNKRKIADKLRVVFLFGTRLDLMIVLLIENRDPMS